MGGGTIGLLVGAAIGLVQGAALWVFFTKIEENAVKGLDRDGVEAKRTFYGRLKPAVLVVDVLVFGLVGWLIGRQFWG
jgi:hypothetical protein